MAALSSAFSLHGAVTLQDLANGGTIRAYDPVNHPGLCYDLTFYNFHNITQNGDLNVPLSEIFVDVIWGGPGSVENEPGIRFSSALWSLSGSNLHYDLSLDFHVKTTGLDYCLSDNTLEFTGGIRGDARTQVAETVIDGDSRDSLAAKLVYIDSNGLQLEDHTEFPGAPYRILEISKDFAMSTGSNGGYVFVSHFDQTFSVVPEANTNLSAIGLASMAGIAYLRRRNASGSKA
jgi:hypothetical protein